MAPGTTSKTVLSQNDSGFTLIETLIGMLIFTIGILGVALMQTQSLRNNSLSQISTDNSNAAMGSVERLYSLPWDLVGPDTYEETQGKYDEFTVAFDITDDVPDGSAKAMVDDRGNAALRLITVTSSFKESSGLNRSTTLRYIKRRP
jgi:prepilin-type N-terminal cleavage/methylation domain-containing protein